MAPHDVVEVTALDGYRLQLRFDDQSVGSVDVSTRVRFEGIFEPLRDPAYFRLARVDRELGTVVWPNGADLDPEVLYCVATGRPIPGEGDTASR